jgi:hypothetical protein
MKDEKKDYAKVTVVSAAFNEYLQTNDVKTRTVEFKSQELLLWQAKFQLIIAQQLTIIAGHLGKIVKKSEDLNATD